MKVLSQSKLLWLIALSISFILSGFSQTSCDRPCVSLLDLGEAKINLRGYMKDFKAVTDEYKNFYTWTRYSDTSQRIAPGPVMIKMGAIMSLFDSVSSIPAKIRGVKINLGLDKNRIIFIFQPLYMKKSTDPTGSGRGWYSLFFKDTSLYYIYNPQKESFSVKKSDEAYGFITPYVENFLIQHTDTVVFDNVRKRDRWDDDTRAVIFSFQEILNLYHNRYPCDSEFKGYCENLYFYNGAANYTDYGTTKPICHKNNIFITTDLLESKNLSGDAALIPQSAANLAHLCPPSCGPLYYKIKRR